MGFQSVRLDFWVKYAENEQEQAMRILDYALLERTRKNKQTVLILTGDPGEAKSSMAQALVEKFLQRKNINYLDFVNDVTVYTPFEFPEKEKALLNDKRLKDIEIMIIDEARLVVKAKNWHEFLNQAIADVFALQRRIKRLLLIVITQDLSDIDKDVRRLVTYWGECYRPLNGQAELRISRFYKDTRDPEHVKLKKRALRGIIELPNGKRKLDFPSRFIFKMPSKEVWNKYDRENYKNKGKVIHKRLKDMLEKMKKDVGIGVDSRSRVLVDYYLTPERYQELLFHFKVTPKGNYRLKKGAMEILGLEKDEVKKFEETVKEGMVKLQKGGEKNGLSEQSV